MWDEGVCVGGVEVGGEVCGGEGVKGEVHGSLPSLAHWDLTMAIPWYCIGASHWVGSMEVFHPWLFGISPLHWCFSFGGVKSIEFFHA